MPTSARTALALSLLPGLAALVAAQTPARKPAPAPAAKKPDAGIAFFEAKIRPVLATKCAPCHSAARRSTLGGLSVDHRDSLLRGGDSGPAIVPGDPEKSLLVRALRHTHPTLKMPPDARLPEAAIADFARWVAMGAPDPRAAAASPAPKAMTLEEGRRFWAFVAPRRPAVPVVRDSAWPAGDIDRFVLAGLEREGLRPAADADRRTLARRVAFDLIGLPPTPETVDAFVADPRPDAYERLVDRLLASPEFGRRWGRHWLDVARYAESSGKEQNVATPDAWRYRDYVIDSVNADKPWDRFLIEQIAGDLLPAGTSRQRAEQIVATGYLAIGPKSLNTPNPLQFKVDVADEQIDALTQGVLGLTVACARCHDHKFDPISTRDYTALAGIFLSTDTRFGGFRSAGLRQASPLISLPADADLPQAPGLRPFELSALRAQLERATEQRDALLAEARRDPQAMRGNPALVQLVGRIGLLETQLARYDDQGRPRALAMGLEEAIFPGDGRIYVRGELDQRGDSVPRGFPAVLCATPPPPVREGSGRLELARWIASAENPLTARVLANRVWKHLFGRGIVPSVDNFGTTGQRPDNQPLLDHLALRLTDQGWSLKKLVREVVLSRAYRMSSAWNAAAFAKDPENRRVWRHSPRRLDAEEIRDAMLRVSGLLDLRTPPGSPVARIEGLVGRARAGVPSTDPPVRSVYLPILRDQVPEALAVFDFAEPSLVTGARETTTVSSQALYLMNAPAVLKASEAMARALLQRPESDAARVERAFRIATGRVPSAAERAASLAFFPRFDAAQKVGESPDILGSATRDPRLLAWSAFCQTLIASAEFRTLN